MALPVILVDSATGSDTQASGAGPSTALFGSTGVTAGDGLTVDLSADAPDLSGVATDGSAVLFMSDTNAGSRNFSKITNVNNTTKVVTVADAFQASNTDAWAIGGKRASIGSTTSRKLVNNNSSTGDVRPGWKIRFSSGHDETLSSTLTLICPGNTTDGPVTIQGDPAYSVLPCLKFSNNGTAISTAAYAVVIEDLEFRNTSATKTLTVLLANSATQSRQWSIRRIKCDHQTNYFRKCIAIAGYAAGWHFDKNTFSTTASGSDCVVLGNDGPWDFNDNYIYNSGGIGLDLSGFTGIGGEGLVCGNIIAGCTVGIKLCNGTIVVNNTIDSCSSHGMEMATDPTSNSTKLIMIKNNIMSNNGGYGLKFTGASSTANYLNACSVQADGNNTYNNTSGAYLPTGFGANDPGLDPQYTDAASGDYSIGTNLKAKGIPLGGSRYIGAYSTTYSYIDPGAAQREESGGGSLNPLTSVYGKV